MQPITQTIIDLQPSTNEQGDAIWSFAPPLAPRPIPIAWRPSIFDMARACRDLDGGRLSANERSFIIKMVALGNRSPSEGQRAWLVSIFVQLSKSAA